MAKKTLSLRGYAAHRACTLQAVQKAIKTGRIVCEKDGSIEPKSADLSWDLASDPSKQRKEAKVRQVRKHADKFAEARADREDYQSKLTKLNYQHKAGLLVDANIVRLRAFENARTVRDAILNIPNRISAELASETDSVKVANMLTVELNRALDELASGRAAALDAPIPVKDDA